MPVAPTKSSRHAIGKRADLPHRVGRHRRGLGEQWHEVQRAERAEEQEHAEHESEVADAVDDECFLARIGRRLLQEIETDQQVAAQAHAFPSDEQQHVVRGEHQDEHEKHEQIQVGEEAVVAAFVRHVAGGIDVDEPADAGDDQQHDDGELIDLQIEARAEVPAAIQVKNCFTQGI